MHVQVKGKCNAISIDRCKKTGVVFENVIAACEMVNCSSVQVRNLQAAGAKDTKQCCLANACAMTLHQ